jgi:hypothetical protein
LVHVGGDPLRPLRDHRGVRIEASFVPVRHGRTTTRSVDGEIAALAGGQHGVVSRAQLISLGLGPGAIDDRLRRGALHAVHRGVFAVGHCVLTREAHWLAAVLAAGPGAVLSHRSAAALWAIRPSHRAAVDVAVTRRCRRPGIDVHQIALAADEITEHHGIPVTSPVRTLLDLAEVLTPHHLERAVHETEYRRLTSPLSLDALLARHRGRRGTAALKAIVAKGRLGATITRLELEIRFLAFSPPTPSPARWSTNASARTRSTVLWPHRRLVVELDSRQAHETARAFERDRARDRDLLTRGHRVIRITWRQLHEDEALIAHQLTTLLAGAPMG